MVDADQVAQDTERRLGLLEAEVARLHRHPPAAPPTPGQAAAARLDMRPDIVRFINSRLGWLILALVQHAGKVFMVEDYCREIVGIDMDTTPYFNSGVMVMDLQAWRRTDLAARCRAQCHLDRALSLVDQDAANQILQGDFLHLDPRWNAFVFLEREYWPRAGDELPSIMSGYEQDLCPPTGDLRAAMRAWADDPWIVHFAHRSKPWRADDRRTAFDDEFWDHAFRTPFGPRLHLAFSN